MAELQIQPSNDCFEFRVNGYHIHSIKNCAICSAAPKAEEPKVLETDDQITKYQAEVIEKQKKIILQADVDENDPDVLMELYERYQNCACCKGLVFNCSGQICEYLGKCFCYQKDQQDMIHDL